MDIIIAAVKTDLTNSLNAGRYMLVSLFTLAVFVRYVGLLNANVNWSQVIVRLVIGFVLLQNYTYVMDTTRDIVSGVDGMVNPNQDYVSQYVQMVNNAQQAYQTTAQQSILTKATNVFFSVFNPRNLIINFSFMFYAVISKVMESVRYSMTAVLYKLGPVLIPLLLFESTQQVVKGWFSSFVSVLCWPILWHIVLGIGVVLSNNNQGLEHFASINFAICFVLVFSPLIVNSIVAGIGAGSAALAAGPGAAFSVIGGLSSLGKNFINQVDQKFTPKKKTPTTTGKFRKGMLGDD